MALGLTKADANIALVRAEMAAGFAKSDSKLDLLRKDMEAMENRLVMRLTKAMLTVAGLTVAVIGCAAGVLRLLA